MFKRSLLFVAVLTLLSVSAFAQNDTRYYFAELRGTNEVPANNSPAVGAAYVTLDANNVVTYEVDWVGMTNPPSLSHIHENVAGVNGSVVVNFVTAASQFASSTRAKGSIQTTPEIASRIRANPAGFYVNVHSNPGFPGGEIRGQLLKQP